jgi:hypothetical protein
MHLGCFGERVADAYIGVSGPTNAGLALLLALQGCWVGPLRLHVRLTKWTAATPLLQSVSSLLPGLVQYVVRVLWST